MAIIEKLAFQRKKDLELIAALKANGSDLSKPHLVEHHFITYNQDNGLALLKWGKENGFQVSKIEEGEWKGKKYYYFDLIKSTIPNIENIYADTRIMLDVASQFFCEYDGWGCLIVSNGVVRKNSIDQL